MKTHNAHPQIGPKFLVRGLSAGATRGVLSLGGLHLPCALGVAGRVAQKREGDGATPIGSFLLREAFYRPDRLMRPRTRLPLSPLRPFDGWCDDPNDRNYNLRVRHPYPASAEHLWRADRLYDLVLVLGYNDHPRARGRGSAIFMHVAKDDFAPTAGCIALRLADLKRVLERASRATIVRIFA
jgi:L,D-peptidoglycan transpeptidase YkuD (ErfK/YbiS/YcfS/YnhG family)